MKIYSLIERPKKDTKLSFDNASPFVQDLNRALGSLDRLMRVAHVDDYAKALT